MIFALLGCVAAMIPPSTDCTNCVTDCVGAGNDQCSECTAIQCFDVCAAEYTEAALQAYIDSGCDDGNGDGDEMRELQMYFVQVWKEQPMPTPGYNMVFIGDSNVDYWDGTSFGGASWDCGGDMCSNALFPNSINIAIEGATAFAMAQDVQSFTRYNENGDVVWYVVHAGSNDLLGMGHSPEVIVNDMMTSIDAMTSTGARVLYYSTARSPGERQNVELLNQYDEGVRNEIMRRAQGVNVPPVVMMDVAELTQSIDDSLYIVEEGFPLPVHFTGELYRLWGFWGLAAISIADYDHSFIVLNSTRYDLY